MSIKRLSVLTMVLLGTFAWGEELRILTEDDPPYNFLDSQGEVKGFAVEIVQEIQRRLNTRSPLSLQPWARAYDTIKTSPNVVLFTMARTVERENMFQWVGPITENRWIAVAPRRLRLKVSSLDDLKNLPTLGVVRDFAWDTYLTSLGFRNLQRTVKNQQNVLKANEGRIQAYISSDNTYRKEIEVEGLDPQDFEIIYVLKTVSLYIAHSKTTSPEIVRDWQQQFTAMRRDGTLESLTKKWLPGHPLPGIARPASD